MLVYCAVFVVGRKVGIDLVDVDVINRHIATCHDVVYLLHTLLPVKNPLPRPLQHTSWLKGFSLKKREKVLALFAIRKVERIKVH